MYPKMRKNQIATKRRKTNGKVAYVQHKPDIFYMDPWHLQTQICTLNKNKFISIHNPNVLYITVHLTKSYRYPSEPNPLQIS